jgi:LPXTG-site transpeptidase (sortase) family protein
MNPESSCRIRTGVWSLPLFVPLLLAFGAGADAADPPPAGASAAITTMPQAANTDGAARAWLEDRPVPDTSDWSAKRIAVYQAERASTAPNEPPEALLRIPSVEIEVPVFAGIEERHLTLGAGRIDGTPPIASGGNTGLAAHRDGYFRALQSVSVNDEIIVETADGSFEYRIVDLLIVTPEAVHVLGPTGKDSITIVTCYPFYYVGNAPERFIVRADRQ